MAKIVSESQQKIYDTLRQSVTARLVRAMDIAEGDLAHLNLGELINALFLIRGDMGSVGSFLPTFHGALKLVGQDLMWQEPDKIAVIPTQRIQ